MIKINNIGYNWIHYDKNFIINRPYGEHDYLFLLFRSKVNILLEKTNLCINSPAIFIYEKEKEQVYGYADEPLTNDWFHFDSDKDGGEIKELLEMLDIPMQTPIYINDTQTISNLINDLEYEYRQPGVFQKNLLDAKIRTLFCKVACICNQEKNIPQSMNKYRKEFTSIRNKIYHLHGLQGIDNISMLAKQADMSVSHFHQVYKMLFNSSPGQDIIKSRISYACVLLCSDNTPIADISSKCNYSNVEHFIRQFKQYMKCTPGEYRNHYI